jgi:hypothetical protein
MLQVGFEPTITASERAKTVHALDFAATVIGRNMTKDENSEDNESVVKILGEGQLKNSSAISQRLAKYEYLPYI